jgi:hypothetical protein
MDTDNLQKWEGNMSAPERRILISNLISKALSEIMEEDNDKMCVGCFERTGCLITMLVNNEYDSKIKPQGMAPGTYTVPTEHSNVTAVLADPEPQNEEDAALAEEKVLINEQNEDDNEGEFHIEDEQDDNGDILDDNQEDLE